MAFDVKYNLDEVKIQNIFKNILFKSVLKIHALAIQNAPRGATDELAQKIDFFPKQYGESSYQIISQAQHSEAVEFGTSPHKVNPNKLKDWARLKLGDENAAYPVAKKIAKVGTDAHPFMYPAFLEVRKIWVPKFFQDETKR